MKATVTQLHVPDTGRHLLPAWLPPVRDGGARCSGPSVTEVEAAMASAGSALSTSLDPGHSADAAGRAGGCRSTGQLPRLPAGRWPTRWPWRVRRTAWPWRWSSSAACAHVVVMSVLIPAEMLVAARRLAGAGPHLAAVAGIVHQEDLWQRCRDELNGVDVRTMEGFRNPAGPGRLDISAALRVASISGSLALPRSVPAAVGVRLWPVLCLLRRVRVRIGELSRWV